MCSITLYLLIWYLCRTVELEGGYPSKYKGKMPGVRLNYVLLYSVRGDIFKTTYMVFQFSKGPHILR